MPSVLTLALLSEDAYESSPCAVDGFFPIVVPEAERFTADGTSFFARCYFGLGVGVVAIRGSMEGDDWLVDDRQILLGNLPRQLTSAIAYFDHAQPALHLKGAQRIVITGHSLGGGLAEAVAARTKTASVSAATFNSPGLLGFTRIVADEDLVKSVAAGAIAGSRFGPLGLAVGAAIGVMRTPTTTMDMTVRNRNIVNVRSEMDVVSRWGTHATEPKVVPDAGAHPIGPLIQALKISRLALVSI